MFGYLIAIPEVVPDAVKTSSDGCDGIEEGVATPDEEYGVLLSKCLPRRDWRIVAVANAAAKPELKDARKEAGYANGAKYPRGGC